MLDNKIVTDKKAVRVEVTLVEYQPENDVAVTRVPRFGSTRVHFDPWEASGLVKPTCGKVLFGFAECHSFASSSPEL